MRLEIHGLLGIVEADINLEGIIEIVGPNASGKTSIASCAQALLAHDANPLGVPAAQAKRVYPHDGDPDGFAALDAATWRPGKGGLTLAPANAPRPSHPGAVGLVDYTARVGDKQKLASLQDALLPPLSTLLGEVEEKLKRYLPANDLQGVIKVIEQRGFDAAANIYAERGRIAKRQWQEITGANYGVKVAADWRPDGWLADMDTMTVQQAQESVVGARDALSALHRVQAVGEAEIVAAKAAAELVPQMERLVRDADAKHQNVAGNLDILKREELVFKAGERAEEHRLVGLRKACESDPSIECPHCQGVVVYEGERLYKFDAAKAQGQRAEAKQKAQEVEQALAAMAATLQGMQSSIADWEATTAKIKAELDDHKANLGIAVKQATHANAIPDSEERRADLAEAEQAVEEAKDVERNVADEALARALAETIARYSEVSRAIGTQGVRAQMMDVGLRQLNAGLAVIAEEAGWPLVGMTDRGAATWDDRPLGLCSESERWRAQAAIQLTLAAISSSKAVVLDRADLLDYDNRAGLIKAVKRVAGKTGLAVLLCSTGKASSNAPWKQLEIVNGRVA